MHFLIEGKCEQERRVLESKNPHNQRKFARQYTGARGRAKGAQTQADGARVGGPERHHAGHRKRVGKRTGYFLNFHHLKPEAFSGFLR